MKVPRSISRIVGVLGVLTAILVLGGATMAARVDSGVCSMTHFSLGVYTTGLNAGQPMPGSDCLGSCLTLTDQCRSNSHVIGTVRTVYCACRGPHGEYSPANADCSLTYTVVTNGSQMVWTPYCETVACTVGCDLVPTTHYIEPGPDHEGQFWTKYTCPCQ